VRALLVFLLLSSTAAAQIINVQPLVAKHEMRKGLEVAVDASLDWRTGNVDLLLAAGNLIARYRNGRHHLFLLGHAEIGIKSGAQFISKDLEHLRYRVQVVRGLDLETFLQHDRDQFRRVALRVVWGAGPRLRIIMTRRIEVAVAVAYLGEYMQIRDDDLYDANSTRLMHRASTYATFLVRINKTFTLLETVYAQPRIGLPVDVRFLEDLELGASVTDHFALKVGWTLAYDNVPPIGVEPLDTSMRVAFQLSW
jgi:putative salt-induced outer membrane protein YdiY